MNRLPHASDIPIQRITIAGTDYRVETDGRAVIATAIDAKTVKRQRGKAAKAKVLARFLTQEGLVQRVVMRKDLDAIVGAANRSAVAPIRYGLIGGHLFDMNRIAIILDAVNAGDGSIGLTLRPEGEGWLLQLRGQDWLAAVMSVRVPSLEVAA